ncbi:unnamed protein product, partial [Strongylus vulgaris]
MEFLFQWDIRGNRAWIKSTIQSFYYFGHMTGSLLSGMISDKFGRKRVFYLAIVTQISCGMLMSIAPTWWLFALFKFGTGISHPGVYAVAIVLGTELVGPKYRGIVSVGTATFIALGELLLVLMAYFISDYRVLQAAIALPSLCLLSYWWLVPESIRWLVVKGRFMEADRVLRKATQINRSTWEQLEKNQIGSNQSTYTILDLMRTP